MNINREILVISKIENLLGAHLQKKKLRVPKTYNGRQVDGRRGTGTRQCS